MPHVVGIDPSLKRTAVFVLDQDGQFVSRRCFAAVTTGFGLGIQARVFRNQAVGRQIRDFLTPLTPVLIAFEGYAFGANRAGHHDIVEHGYELRRMLCALEPLPRFLEVPPTTLKKHATGNGAADKIEVAVKMSRLFPHIDFNTNDETDSAALAVMGLQVAGFQEPTNEKQRDSLKKIVGTVPVPVATEQGSAPF